MAELITTPVAAALLLIAVLGHVMAFVWYLAAKYKWRVTQPAIYDLPLKRDQIRRELKNSLYSPIHAVILLVFLSLGSFRNVGLASFLYSVIFTSVWAEIWHYATHRAFHLRALHWIHAEHHRSQLNSPFTAISFSLTEKLIFDVGLLSLLVGIDQLISLNFFGVAAWYTGYLVMNSLSHANFELKPKDYNSFFGKVLTSATYHALHHSRYTRNYGLGTRVLDRILKTEWEDYERVYDRTCGEQRPLTRLRERVEALGGRANSPAPPQCL
jgi:lathosterol oxidase